MNTLLKNMFTPAFSTHAVWCRVFHSRVLCLHCTYNDRWATCGLCGG